jgi:signal transduction histidine kinase
MRLKNFDQLRLSSQFLIASFPVIALCTVLIGSWVGHEVKLGIARRLGSEAALYVDGFLARRLEFIPGTKDLTPASIEAIDSVLVNTSLRKKVAALYLWGADGKIIYSRKKFLIGRHFPLNKGISDAYAGNIFAEIIKPSDNDLERDLRKGGTLIDAYVPIPREDTGEALAIAEFFITADELNREAKMAELHSWLIIAAVFALAYILLFRVVRNGSNTIESQRESLNEKLQLVTSLNEQNQLLNERVRLAAARVTTLNEDFLRRISADLHDGPAQDLGLALMKVQTLCQTCDNCPSRQRVEQINAQESPTVRMLLQAALSELRAISAGLQLPNLKNLSTNHIILRAVQDYRMKVNVFVAVDLPSQEREASLPVKITLYRILQESLLNGYRHAHGRNQKVCAHFTETQVKLEISDAGKGFDINAIPEQGHLGIKGMRERVEALGGNFMVDSSPCHGTVIRVSLPLTVPGDEHG